MIIANDKHCWIREYVWKSGFGKVVEEGNYATIESIRMTIYHPSLLGMTRVRVRQTAGGSKMSGDAHAVEDQSDSNLGMRRVSICFSQWRRIIGSFMLVA